MYYLVRRRRHLGIAIPMKQLEHPLKENVHIRECPSDALGRNTVSAELFGFNENNPSPFPALLDVQITSMATNGMNLSGVEQVGDALYAQSWLCQLE